MAHMRKRIPQKHRKHRQHGRPKPWPNYQGISLSIASPGAGAGEKQYFMVWDSGLGVGVWKLANPFHAMGALQRLRG